MFELEFNNRNPRVVQAKARKLLGKWLAPTLGMIGFLGLFGFAYLLIIDEPLGWFAGSTSLFFGMIYLWYKGNLETILPDGNNNSIEMVLDAELLSKLSKAKVSSTDISTICKNTFGDVFFADRFAVSADIIKFAAESNVSNWWDEAVALWQSYPTETGVVSSHIIAALILTSSHKMEILTALATTEEDLRAGVGWAAYLTRTFAAVRIRQSAGGIARDWATGYTPMLDRFAYNISRDIRFGLYYHRDVFGHQQVVSQIKNALSQAGRSNVILVGELGVGKTTCVEALANSLIFGSDSKSPLAYHQIYKVDTSAMLSQMDSQNKLENALASLCVEAFKAKNIILYFPDIANLFGIEGGIDTVAIMLPFVQGGGVRMIFSATEGQWKWLQQNKSQLASLMNFQAVTAPDQSDTMKILENKAISIEHQYKSRFTYAALKEIYRLSSRYGVEISMPARAINVMETTARISPSSLLTKESVALAIEQTTGVRVGGVTADERGTLLELDSVLHKRVIGQEEAIKSVVSSLQRSRAGVSNQNKPIGTFLFLGPTGVGKTETAKAVAEAFFGGEDRLIRIDMNEFVTSDSISRLLESGSTQSNSLLDAVRKQPFSVVLFDEIEKAHSDVVNSLLQLLDEGVMRDGANRVVSFRDAIVIATSNAGVENIGSYNEQSIQSPENAKREFLQGLISSGHFKPELLNRFDTVVIYQPLRPDQLELVVDIQLAKINENLAMQQLRVELAPEARSWLAQRGHDPLMGARPLRRLLQETVETIISRKILDGSLQSGSGATITLDVSDLN